MEEIMSSLSEQTDPKIPQVSRKNNGFSRNDVVGAFQQAFDIIGGTSRLALWANANPDKFYPLYAKLMPATTQIIGDAGELVILHRLAPTALDVHELEDVTAACQSSNLDTLPDSTSQTSMLETSDGQSLSPIDEPERP
jgi:hypothetical protein